MRTRRLGSSTLKAPRVSRAREFSLPRDKRGRTRIITPRGTSSADDDDTEGQGETRSRVLGQYALPRAGGPPRDNRSDVVGGQRRGGPADAAISGASAAARAGHIAVSRK